MHKRFTLGEKGARPQSWERLGAGAAVQGWSSLGRSCSWTGLLEIQESPKGFRRRCNGEQLRTQCLCTSIDAMWLREGAARFHISSPAESSRVCPLDPPVCQVAWACMPGVCRCVYKSLGFVWVCAHLHLGLHVYSEDRDLAVTAQQHMVPPCRWLSSGTWMVSCKMPQRNLLLSHFVFLQEEI